MHGSALNDGGVSGEGRNVCVQKFHSWGKCTMPLTNINSDWMFNASSGLCIILLYCRAQRSGARLGNRDVVYTALQSRPRDRQMYVKVLAPGGPRKFGTRDLYLLLGVSKYVSDRGRYF